MSDFALRCTFLCLISGGALGALFLLCKVLRMGLGLGKWAVAVLDILFCLFASVTAFLCALAIDSGRLRFFQAALQLLGGVSVVLVFDPFVSKGARGLRFLLEKGKRGFSHCGERIRGLFPEKKRQKRSLRRRKSWKKSEKGLEKLM